MTDIFITSPLRLQFELDYYTRDGLLCVAAEGTTLTILIYCDQAEKAYRQLAAVVEGMKKWIDQATTESGQSEGNENEMGGEER
jgi:hypothetical protein